MRITIKNSNNKDDMEKPQKKKELHSFEKRQNNTTEFMSPGTFLPEQMWGPSTSPSTGKQMSGSC